MTLRLLLSAAVVLSPIGSGIAGLASGQTPVPDASVSAPTPSSTLADSSKSSPSPSPTFSLAPFKERLANAASVKVMTTILGIELGSTLEQAHAKFDKISDPAHKPQTEGAEKGEEGEQKVLWQLAKTDYAQIYVKADENERITYIAGFLRPGKEIPFDKIGETKKAPVQDTHAIAWDVVRPKTPLFRVVAQGADRKANNILIFVVKRPNSIRSKTP